MTRAQGVFIVLIALMWARDAGVIDGLFLIFASVVLVLDFYIEERGDRAKR